MEQMVFSLGALPMRSKGTHHEIVTGEEDNDWSNWKVRVVSHSGDRVNIFLLIS